MHELRKLKYHDFWPTRRQERILTAALMPGNEGLASWEEWYRGVPENPNDEGGMRLWPLVYKNLKKTTSQNNLPDDLKGKYIKTIFQNKMKFDETLKIISIFERNEIQSLLLKGIALTVGFYHDLGLRPMSDLDIAVPHAQAERATSSLIAAGWRHKWPPYIATPASAHAATLVSPTGSELDLHYSPIENIFRWSQIEPFWKSATVAVFNGRRFQTLCATDHLFQTIAHGTQFNPVAPIRWVADATWILRSEVGIDWDLFIERARALSFSLVMLRALDYLNGRFGILIPAEVLVSLRVGSSPLSYLEYWRRRIGPDIEKKKTYAKIVNFWTNYGLRYPERSLTQLMFDFPAFLRDHWSADTVTNLIQTGVNKVRRI